MSELPAGILIDLDDTILDDGGCVDSCWEDACAEVATRSPAIDPVVLHETIRVHAREWWDDADRHQRGRLDLRAATTEIVSESMRKLGYDAAEAGVIAHRYRDLREERAALFPGALETLEWFRERGVKLGLMTNGAGPAQRAKIDRFAIEHHFEHVVIEGEAGYGKPDRRVYETLLRELQLDAKDTWAIGDNLVWDVFAPMEFGMYGIWVDAAGHGLPAGETRKPDRVVKSIRELVQEDGGFNG
ncbi:MAG: HAD family hydrolase [Chloroflexota bacterium]